MTIISSHRPGGFRGIRPAGRYTMAVVRPAVLLALSLAVSSCAILEKPVRPAVYDFGPGAMSQIASGAVSTLPLLTLAEVESASALDSTSVLYRLTYVNAQQLLPYAQARWSMTPAQLLRQRLRESLGQRRTVLNPGDGNLTGAQSALLLKIDLEEFSQLFVAPGQSVGQVRLRATLVQTTPGGDRLMGQRMVVAQRAAPSADAPGGVRALAEASQAAVEELEQWLSQFR